MHKLGYAIAPGEHRQKDVISNSWAIIMFGIRMRHGAGKALSAFPPKWITLLRLHTHRQLPLSSVDLPGQNIQGESLRPMIEVCRSSERDNN